MISAAEKKIQNQESEKNEIRSENSLNFKYDVDFHDPKIAFAAFGLGDLVRNYFILGICKIPGFVAYSEKLLDISKRIFGNRFTNFIVKKTFFKQFCAGESETEIIPVVKKLRQYKLIPILDYAAEKSDDFADDVEKHSDQNYENFVRQMKITERLVEEGDKRFAELKVTALCNPEVLGLITKKIVEYNKSNSIKFFSKAFDLDLTFNSKTVIDFDNFMSIAKNASKNASIDFTDLSAVKFYSQLFFQLSLLGLNIFNEGEFNTNLLNLTNRIFSLCLIADSLGIKLLIDAEQSYYQPCIDLLTVNLQSVFNSKNDKMTVFNTYQCYLKETKTKIDLFLEIAQKQHFGFCAKVVRGAYVVEENKRAKALDYEPPVFSSIAETHHSYNSLCQLLLQKASQGQCMFVFGTHNEESIKKILCVLVQSRKDFAEVVFFGQLFGMGNNLSFPLAAAGFSVVKLVPYGNVEDVLKFLVRRAQENNSLLGNADVERKLVFKEIFGRIFGTK